MKPSDTQRTRGHGKRHGPVHGSALLFRAFEDREKSRRASRGCRARQAFGPVHPGKVKQELDCAA